MNNYVKHFFSINEGKTSVIIIGFLVVLGFAMYKYNIFNDISINIKELLFAFIATIGGVNIIPAVTQFAQTFSNKDTTSTTTTTSISNNDDQSGEG